jgi:hypothetical protein
MSITTYATLQTSITASFGGRTDLTTYYPDWITLFEAMVARKLADPDWRFLRTDR